MNAAVSGSCIGSSPLARGTQSACRRLQAEVWLIPARAGNTSIAWLRACIRSAHPRSRGEHRGLNPRYIQKCGSSPLVRGTCTHQRNQPLLVRLIPARAGNTSRQSASCSWPRAHPRSRGEHFSSSHLEFPVVGSSPLARGKLNVDRLCMRSDGLIPARARAGNIRTNP